MSTRERCNQVIDSLPEEYLAYALLLLEKIQREKEAAEDDAFCIAMNEAFLEDPDPDKWESTPIEELAAQLGITLL